MAAKLPPALLALTPGTLVGGPDVAAFVQQAKQLIDGGLRGILLREPNLGDRELLSLARDLKSVLVQTEDESAWLGVHDCLHVAQAAAADGAHIGFRSLDVTSARRLLGPKICLGVSTHCGDSAAKWAGADYVFHSPVFYTPSKAGLLEPIGPEQLLRFAQHLQEMDGPRVWGLGGITPDNCDLILGLDHRAQPHGIVVRGALFDSDSSLANLTDLLGLLRTHQVHDNRPVACG